MREIAAERGIAEYFIEIFGSPNNKATICKNILKKYSFSPNEVLMVGDAIDDYNGARDAGIGFIGRITGKNIFSGTDAQAVIADMTDLEKFI